MAKTDAEIIEAWEKGPKYGAVIDFNAGDLTLAHDYGERGAGNWRFGRPDPVLLAAAQDIIIEGAKARLPVPKEPRIGYTKFDPDVKKYNPI